MLNERQSKLFLSCVVLCMFPEMSSSCARPTISIIAGNEDRELNESVFIGMGTRGCDNSQKGCLRRSVARHIRISIICQPASPSVCLPHSAHKTDKLHLQRKHVLHVQRNEKKQHPKCDTMISNSSIVQHFSSVSNYYSCSRNKEFQSILSKLSR